MEATLKSFAPSIQNSEGVCSVCGDKTLRTAEFMGIKRTFRVMCKSMQKQQEEEKLSQLKQDRMRIAQKLKKYSLVGERYKNTRLHRKGSRGILLLKKGRCYMSILKLIITFAR